MKVNESIRYGKLPYWRHNGHTAVCSERIDLEDGTADCTLVCECGDTWIVAQGVDHSEVPDEG